MNLHQINRDQIEKDKILPLLLDICMFDTSFTTKEMFKDLIIKGLTISSICKKYKKNPSTISSMRKRITYKLKNNALNRFLLREYYGKR